MGTSHCKEKDFQRKLTENKISCENFGEIILGTYDTKSYEYKSRNFEENFVDQKLFTILKKIEISKISDLRRKKDKFGR